MSLASDGEPGAGGGAGSGGGGRFVVGARPRQGVGGTKPPPVRGTPGRGRTPPVAPSGSTRRPRTMRAPVGVAGGGGGQRTRRREALLVASGVRQGRGFRVEGEARSDPGWPALARCLAELARVALWLAPKLKVDLLRLLGRCTVLAERVFAAAEGWGTGEIVTRFLGFLGEMTEDAFESLTHLGTSPRPKKATISDEILRKGLGEMGECPIPRDLLGQARPGEPPRAPARGTATGGEGLTGPTDGGDAGGLEGPGSVC